MEPIESPLLRVSLFSELALSVPPLPPPDLAEQLQTLLTISPRLKALSEVHTYLKELYEFASETDPKEQDLMEKYTKSCNDYLIDVAQDSREEVWAEAEYRQSIDAHNIGVPLLVQDRKSYSLVLTVKAMSFVAFTEAHDLYAEHGLDPASDWFACDQSDLVWQLFALWNKAGGSLKRMCSCKDRSCDCHFADPAYMFQPGHPLAPSEEVLEKYEQAIAKKKAIPAPSKWLEGLE